MRIIHVSRRGKAINQLLDQARAEDVVVRAADGDEFLVTPIDDFDQEVARTRRNKKLMAFLEARAKETETISFEEVKRRLELASRKGKRKVAGPHGRRSR
jgi:hypothetical protein